MFNLVADAIREQAVEPTVKLLEDLSPGSRFSPLKDFEERYDVLDEPEPEPEVEIAEIEVEVEPEPESEISFPDFDVVRDQSIPLSDSILPEESVDNELAHDSFTE